MGEEECCAVVDCAGGVGGCYGLGVAECVGCWFWLVMGEVDAMVDGLGGCERYMA